MRMASQENMLFGNGIEFVEGLERQSSNNTPKISDEEFSNALSFLMPQMKRVTQQITELDNDFKMPNTVLNIKIKPEYLAKSKKIDELYNKSDLQRVGSFPITEEDSESEKDKKTRIEYLRGPADNLDQLFRQMDDGNKITNNLRAEIIRIEEISLATVEEKLSLLPSDWNSGRAYLILHPMADEQLLLAKVKQLLPGQNYNDWKMFRASDGLIYLSMKLSRSEINSLAPFNALRQVMPQRGGGLTQVEGEFDHEPNVYSQDDYSANELGPLTVGQIDGGILTDKNAYLSEIKEIAHVTSNPSNFFQEHGTSVGSVLMYGDLNNVIPGDQISATSRIKTIRVLPTGMVTEKEKNVEDFDFVEAASLIAKVVPQNPDVKVWNVSVGPFGPVLVDDIVGPLTEVLDNLAFKFKILFCVAVGNTGDLGGGEWARIQTPSDMVNGIAVGGYYINEKNDISLANYTSIGPGREGGVIKPDVLAHGGFINDKVLTFATYNYILNGAYGTSFATPLVARAAVQLLSANRNMEVLDTKALVIHEATLHESDIPINRGGHGFVSDIGNVLESNDDEYRILYSSEMSTGSYVKLDIPMPDLDDLKSNKFEFAWTVCVMSPVSATEVDEYVQCTAEVGFHPDSTKYTYNHESQHVTLNESDPQVERLLADGWTRGAFPTSNPGKKYKQLTEQSLRDKLKWDTVKSDRVNKQKKSINHPFLVLHGLSRDGSHTRIPYSVVVTVRAKEDNNLYQMVKAKHPILEPINNIVRNQV